MAGFIQKKKLLIFISVLIFMVLALLVSRFTYSYLGAYLGDDVITRGETTASGDTLIFIDGEPLSLKASTKNFHADAGNLSDSTKPGVRLISSGKTNNAKANYTVGFRINENTYKYSTSNNTPELLLAIYDENNNIVTTSYDDLNFVTVTDGDGNEVSGFDITGLEGAFNVSVDHPITTTSSTTGTTHYWTFELIFVNLEGDQSINENSNLNIDVILKQGMINTNYMLLALDDSSYNGEIWGYKDDITSIVIQSNDTSLYSDASYVFDVSDEKDKGVMAYLVDNGDGTYTSYIQSKADKVIANTNSQYLFANFPNLENIEGLENLDVSNVTNMSYMFRGATSLLNLDLSSWNTNNVNNMSYMFNSGGDTSYMSLETITFGPGWDTSKVTTMRSMFWNCANLTSLDVSMFKTQNVTNMSGMFGGYGKSMSLESITFGPGWDTSKVTTMRTMFQRQSNLTNLDVGNWDTGNVTDMESMFNFTSSLTTLDVSDWDTSAVTNMSYMFRGATSLTNLDLSSWNTNNVNNMSYMFNSGWDTSYMSLETITFGPGWDTSNVTTMESMFWNCANLTSLDVSMFKTRNVTDMSGMFGGYGKSMSLESITFGPGWDTSKVTTMRTMFQRQSKLTSLDLSMFNTSNVTDMSYMFVHASSLTTIDVSDWDTSAVTDMSYMFSVATSLTNLDLSSWNTSNVTNMSYMFRGATSLTNLDLSSWNTSNVTNMSYMFQSGGNTSYMSLETITFGPGWDTSNVTTMGSMFWNCANLTSLDVSMFKTQNVTNMSGMFGGYGKSMSLESITFGPGWDTSKVTTMRTMFQRQSKLTSLDLSMFNTSNVTDMSYMFSNCSSLTNLNFSNADFSNVTSYTNMFTSNVSSSIVVTVKDATAQTFIQNRLGSGKGTVNIS